MQLEHDTAQPAAAGAELAAYFDGVRAHRAELHESLSAVDLALESALGRDGAWRERVGAALGELAHDFGAHVELSESPGGLYDRVRSTAPRLSSAIDRLRDEHRELGHEIDSHLALLEHDEAGVDLARFREELTTLVRRLRRHRQAGGDLVYEAYEVDLGGSG